MTDTALHFTSDGTKPCRPMFLAQLHSERLWAMPPLLTAAGEEFDKMRISLYRYRHSYAQRHADAGTQVDVLWELRGHKTSGTTQTYYVCGSSAPVRPWTGCSPCSSTRMATGCRTRPRPCWTTSTPGCGSGRSPYRSGCAEPSNVKARGHPCPFRFRCLSRDHFRTAPSFLPGLLAYLDTLLRNRERLNAAGELDNWARAEVTPGRGLRAGAVRRSRLLAGAKEGGGVAVEELYEALDV
ncbi:hypothetical protein [Streptomyces sp. NPDC046197]|uniref:hypothetical protein n=1 Tax=Streptomyces sp. NPDC046197 TaxID=3154337 RepID=UPI0033E7CD7C